MADSVGVGVGVGVGVASGVGVDRAVGAVRGIVAGFGGGASEQLARPATDAGTSMRRPNRCHAAMGRSITGYLLPERPL